MKAQSDRVARFGLAIGPPVEGTDSNLVQIEMSPPQAPGNFSTPVCCTPYEADAQREAVTPEPMMADAAKN
jgi:hypothetical protein